jgi:hypothetical protein
MSEDPKISEEKMEQTISLSPPAFPVGFEGFEVFYTKKKF